MARSQLKLGLLILLVFAIADAKGSRVISSTLSNNRRAVADYKTVEVTFRIDQHVAYKQGFVVTGNTSQFGNWDTTKGIQLKYSSGDVWTASVNISSGSAIEFKPVRVDYDSKRAIEWLYLSENLALLVPPTDPSVTVLMFWCGNPSSHFARTRPAFTNAKLLQSKQEVAFQLERRVDFGQGFVIAGSISQLGNWTPQNGLSLSFNKGDIWTGKVSLSSGSNFQYKPVRVRYDDNYPLQWSADPNRNVAIPGDIDEPIIIPVRWSSCPSGGSVDILINEVV